MAGAGSLMSGLGIGSSSGDDVDYRGAKKGIRWRVRDARIAGIHPLFAMGAPGVGQGQILRQQGSDPGAGFQGVGQALQQAGSQAERAEIKNYQDSMRQIERRHAMATMLQAETEARYMNDQYLASVEARKAQKATQGMGELEAIPWDMQLFRNFKTGEVYPLPARATGIELPEFYGAYRMFEPGEYGARTDPSTWQKGFRDQYQW